jgi:diguanylate cyclase (GGDEF)-like protein
MSTPRASAQNSERSALVVDSDHSMARAHAEVLRKSGWRCTVASGADSALEAMAAESFECLVISLSRPKVVSELLASPPRSGRSRPRLVGVRFDDDPIEVPRRFDAIVVKPSPPEALTAAAEPAGPPRLFSADQLAALLEGSALDRGGSDVLARTAERIQSALGAAAGIVFTDRKLWCAGWEGDKKRRSELIVRILEAAEAETPLVTSALVTTAEGRPYERDFETYLALSSRAEDNAPRVVVAAVFPETDGSLAALQRPLAALARRLAEERAWQTVLERVSAELDAVRELGGLDPRLGIWNRSTLDRLVDMMVTSSRRTSEPLAIAVINVIGLGRINDMHGHREGDAILRHVAEVAVYVVRGSDAVGRYQDDDIAIVFHGATAVQAMKVVERIRSTLAAQPFRTDDGAEIEIATSAGVTELGGPRDTGERALVRAATAAARSDVASEIVSSFFDGAESQDKPITVRRSLEGVTFGGSYRVLHEIGAGGGGGVFRGEDLGLQRPVAIKVLRPELSQNKEFVERFRTEAATLAALRDPHLVQVYAFGLEDGHAYFVMELVEGESLFETIVRSRREKTAIPIERVRMVLLHIASALRALHKSGIIHRDVKPANILLDPFRDRSVLVDVGIASRRGERTNLAGTPGYMAPEAAVSVDIDASADVYGLAVTLYEMLTLELPWPMSEDPLQILNAQRNTPPKPPSEFNPALAPLDEALLAALRTNPSERFASVEHFARAVDKGLGLLDASRPAAGDKRAPAPLAVALAPTMVWTAASEDEPRTRGVVFRALPRVLGPRAASAWLLELKTGSPRLAEALSATTLPLGWLPTRLLIELLESAPAGFEELGRDLGKASVRSTFRRFFPASTATLAPASTLNALPSIWPRYHTWGQLNVVPRTGQSATLRIKNTPKSPSLCGWTLGTLEQLIILSGGDEVRVEHPSCETQGGRVCRFEAKWMWDPTSNRSWLAR